MNGRRSAVALIGLVRVSADQQNTRRQHDALAPICLKVFEEKVSGKLDAGVKVSVGVVHKPLTETRAEAERVQR